MAAAAGASPRQKSVPLPRSLTELQQAAALQFHHVGRLRMYHEGREVNNISGVGDLQDGELVTIRLDKRGALPTAGRQTPIETSHQAAFINHGRCTPLKPIGSDADSTLTQQSMGKQFGGHQSMYASDYHRMPRLERPVIRTQFQDHWPKTANLPQEQSNYDLNYTEHLGATSAKAAGSDYDSVLTSQAKGHAFTSRTHYTENYPPRKPVPVTRAAVHDNDSTLTDAVMGQPLDTMSSYQDHFVRHPMTDRVCPVRPYRGIPLQPRTFAGCSEYRNQYVPTERSPRLRLQLMM
jgi:hypothetical protein